MQFLNHPVVPCHCADFHFQEFTRRSTKPGARIIIGKCIREKRGDPVHTTIYQSLLNMCSLSDFTVVWPVCELACFTICYSEYTNIFWLLHVRGTSTLIKKHVYVHFVLFIKVCSWKMQDISTNAGLPDLFRPKQPIYLLSLCKVK